MLKKLDKLIIKAFVGPFFVTLSVVVFIFLTQFIMNNFEELIGKNLGPEVYLELIFYFSMNMVPQSMPISVLLASIMTYGNLGEHRELTAIKSAGISLTRIIRPVMVLSIILACGNWVFYDRVVPKVNLKAFSLLYDIKTKKMALDIKPGVFYYGLPGYTVKVGDRAPDGVDIKQVMIYDHSNGMGNTTVILADSGKMYTMMNERYLVLELFNGGNYSDVHQQSAGNTEFIQNRFDKSKMVFSLSSFDMNRTNVELFASNKLMRNSRQLISDVDSLERERLASLRGFGFNVHTYYTHQFKPNTYGMTVTPNFYAKERALDTLPIERKREVASLALNQARNMRTFATGYMERQKTLKRDQRLFYIELVRKLTQSVAVFVLFLIGAPIGAIIKKGGLGLPVIVSIVFFIIFYIITMTGEKWAKEAIVEVQVGMWAANFVLLVFGLYFLYLARTDSNLFEGNFVQPLIALFNRKKQDTEDATAPTA